MHSVLGMLAIVAVAYAVSSNVADELAAHVGDTVKYHTQFIVQH